MPKTEARLDSGDTLETKKEEVPIGEQEGARDNNGDDTIVETRETPEEKAEKLEAKEKLRQLNSGIESRLKIAKQPNLLKVKPSVFESVKEKLEAAQPHYEKATFDKAAGKGGDLEQEAKDKVRQYAKDRAQKVYKTKEDLSGKVAEIYQMQDSGKEMKKEDRSLLKSIETQWDELAPKEQKKYKQEHLEASGKKEGKLKPEELKRIIRLAKSDMLADVARKRFQGIKLNFKRKIASDFVGKDAIKLDLENQEKGVKFSPEIEDEDTLNKGEREILRDHVEDTLRGPVRVESGESLEELQKKIDKRDEEDDARFNKEVNIGNERLKKINDAQKELEEVFDKDLMDARNKVIDLSEGSEVPSAPEVENTTTQDSAEEPEEPETIGGKFKQRWQGFKKLFTRSKGAKKTGGNEEILQAMPVPKGEAIDKEKFVVTSKKTGMWIKNADGRMEFRKGAWAKNEKGVMEFREKGKDLSKTTKDVTPEQLEGMPKAEKKEAAKDVEAERMAKERARSAKILGGAVNSDVKEGDGNSGEQKKPEEKNLPEPEETPDSGSDSQKNELQGLNGSEDLQQEGVQFDQDTYDALVKEGYNPMDHQIVEIGFGRKKKLRIYSSDRKRSLEIALDNWEGDIRNWKLGVSQRREPVKTEKPKNGKEEPPANPSANRKMGF